jgi:hypothetical protein
MEETNDGRMGAAQNLHDASFSTCWRAWRMASVAAFDASDNPIPVHGVSQLVRGDEEVAIEVASWRIGDYEAVSIAMCYQPACEQIGIAFGWLRLCARSCRGFCFRARFRPSARETILTTSQLFHESLPLQPR